MDINISKIMDKFEPEVIKNINSDNFKKIILFLNDNGIKYIEDIIEDYLDIFAIDYEDFKNKFNILNKKYNYNLTKILEDDLSVLEEIYFIN